MDEDFRKVIRLGLFLALFAAVFIAVFAVACIVVRPYIGGTTKSDIGMVVLILGCMAIPFGAVALVWKAPRWIRKKIWHTRKPNKALMEKVLKASSLSQQSDCNYNLHSYSYFDYGSCMWDMGGPTYVVDVEKKTRRGEWQLILRATSSHAPMTSALYGNGWRAEVNSREEKALNEFLSRL